MGTSVLMRIPHHLWDVAWISMSRPLVSLRIAAGYELGVSRDAVLQAAKSYWRSLLA